MVNSSGAGYGHSVGPDLVLTQGSDGAPAVAEVEHLYRQASRDAPLWEPPEVAGVFAELYGALLPRPDLLTTSLRAGGRLVGFAYGHPWHWTEQADPWGRQLHTRLDAAADLLEDSFAVCLLVVDPSRRRQGLGGTLLDTLLAETRQRAWLVTRDEPTPALALYEQRGWRRVGHGPDAPNGRPGLVLLHD
ncbi:GNAT family N-acetyltransferase [Modestobacter sp. VKM Ac-2984]|uniref:GNAT family N-acetyltransferase n=1 Tax=Modestobacter sp. VKM Ac-2984 TaxID=3004138 RepID=UPI0022AAD3A5|nr:GNAT family N-acetyltransferase [Modestobacter sp. VKM Ac-2984]MCZ2818413.1 GNAT family N-acetyltransferase [Modestobacter sp. VKM Ac-2984]